MDKVQNVGCLENNTLNWATNRKENLLGELVKNVLMFVTDHRVQRFAE